MSTSKEDRPVPTAGAWWANILSQSSLFPCSACLTQVEWVDANASNVPLQEDRSSLKAMEQPRPSACVRDRNVLNNSLIDEDEDSNQTSDHTAEVHVHDITFDIATESYDEQRRRLPLPIRNHPIAIVTPPRDCGDYSSAIGDFGSCASKPSSDDDNIGECPICLHPMSNADLLYPMQCAGKNCSYNFCLKCISSLFKASEDSFEMASDGNLHVKVHLNCPNCRTSIKGIIEDVIHRRQEILAQLEGEDDESSCDSRLTVGASTSMLVLEEMESEEFLDNVATIPRLKNRARAPTYIRHKRKNDLMKELDSIPAPTLVRDQVMATCDRSRRDPSQPMFSSTISRPFYSSEMMSSVDTEMTGFSRRRSKSFDADRRSHSSVIDEAFWTGVDQHGSSSSSQNDNIHRVKKTNHCDTSTTGLEDDFLANLDRYWCCSSNDVNASNIIDLSGSVHEKSRGCGGYIDYLGTYYQCTANTYALQPCQGCVFRRGIKDGDDGNVHQEDLYYDSDCGQQFAVGTWAPAAINHADNVSLLDTSSSTHSSFLTNTRESSTSLFGQRKVCQHYRPKSDSAPTSTPQRRRHHRSNSDVTPTFDENDIDQVETQEKESLLRTKSTPSFPTKSTRGEQHTDEVVRAEQQAYIYDYFSQGESPIRTGVCSTKKSEIGNYVQDALNSRWRLEWHHAAPNGNPSLLRRHPRACEVWIERAYFRNHNEVVEPTLMWRELTQPGLKPGQGMLTESTLNPYRVSLFALRRIVPVADGDEWQRMSFNGQKPRDVNAWKPMAKPNCLIAVRSSVGQEYLFEASCPEERDRIIHLWKMTTARLVSHSVMGNSAMMMREFFNEGAIKGGLYIDCGHK